MSDLLATLASRPALVALVSALLTFVSLLALLASTAWAREWLGLGDLADEQDDFEMRGGAARHKKAKKARGGAKATGHGGRTSATRDLEAASVAVEPPLAATTVMPRPASPPPAVLNIDALEIERPIGSGGQGGVWLARDTRTGKLCALKQLHKGRLASLRRRSPVEPHNCQWIVERDALYACHGSPFVTACLATFQDAHSLYFALELCAGGAPRVDGALPRGSEPPPL